MKTIEFSKQSLRLAEFVKETGYSVNAFAKECGIPSTRTMTQIIKEGKSPSGKVLDKIITRFPQLNHDWVVLGYGEMIVKGIVNQPASAASIGKSKAASFESINDNQVNHDFQLNELTNRIDKALVLQAQSTQLIQNQIMQMANTLDEKMKEWHNSVQKVINIVELMGNNLPVDIKASLKEAGDNTDRIIINTIEVTANEVWKEIQKHNIVREKKWSENFNDARAEHIDFILKLDVERTKRIAEDTNKVAVKIIDTLNENTQKAIDEIKG